MMIREKIGALFIVGFDGLTPPQSLIELIQDCHIGGVILFRRNIKSPSQLSELVSGIKSAAGGKPMFISIDCEGGNVFRLPPPFTQWGTFAELGEDYEKRHDATIAYKRGLQMALELKSVGINLNFAPVLDVATNIKNPVIGARAFSNKANIVAELGLEFIRGSNEGGVIACGKHFPGHGDTSSDSHTSLPHLPNTFGRLRALELVPFQYAIDAGISALMTAHVIYDEIDPYLPATLSRNFIKGILRKKMGFNGVVITDDLQMAAISEPLPEACIKALAAGCDICLICRDNWAQRSTIEACIEAVSAGNLSEERINSAYSKVSMLWSQITPERGRSAVSSQRSAFFKLLLTS